MNDGDGKEATYDSMRWVAVIGSMFLSWVLTVAQKNDEGFVKNYGQAQRPERSVPQRQLASPLINSPSRQGGDWMQDVVCLNHSFGEVGWLLSRRPIFSSCYGRLRVNWHLSHRRWQVGHIYGGT